MQSERSQHCILDAEKSTFQIPARSTLSVTHRYGLSDKFWCLQCCTDFEMGSCASACGVSFGMRSGTYCIEVCPLILKIINLRQV
jgi:hypothetical protein